MADWLQFQFVVRRDLADRKPWWGLNLVLADKQLYVSQVEAGGDTKSLMLADVPNSVLQSQTLQLGDHIVSVNSVVDPGGLLDELASPHHHTLHMATREGAMSRQS